MAIRVLGPLDTGNEHALSPRERVILAALIVRAGHTVAPGELADAFWRDAAPRTWPQQVRTSVARIRTSLGSTAVLTRGSEYMLGVDPATIDAFEFERFVSQARQHALHGEHDRAIDAYERGLVLWRGAAYVELADWEPAAVEAARLAEVRDSAQEELLESRLAEGENRSLIADAERLVRAAPLREDRWSILAIANYRAGRQAEALATVRTARSHLADELGIDLGERLRALEASMLQHDPSLTPPQPLHRVSDTCPYRGLRPFSPADAEDFFGRDADIDAIRERVGPGSLTVVVGASGSGKSSLVLAGVVPRASAARRVAAITAGRETALELRARVDQPGTAEIVVIDQAEAVFQLGHDEQEELCRLVADALADGTAVIMTLRSDFLDQAAGLPRIGPSISRGVYALGPLTAGGLREAIERPAVRAGLRLEPGLVEVILRDAADRSTTLPHVSHALAETWVRREGATLTVAGYEASGGIAGAIAQSAETLYRSLDEHDADACRSLVLRLVHRGADGVSVRRTAAVAPLIADTTRRRVLDRLVGARLVTIDADTVTLAHEAVATAWPRLDGWLEEDAEGARLVGIVSTAAELWNGSGRRDEDLLRGARLQAALDWREGAQPDLTVVEREFLDASAEREGDELRELAERSARDKRSNRRLRWAITGAAVLLVAALVGGGVAAVRSVEAELAVESAQIEALVATSLALPDNDRETAALLAAEAYRRWPDDPRVRSALWGVITSTNGLVDTHRDEGAQVPTMKVIPGTLTALRVSSGEDGAESVADIVDIATGAVIRTFGLELPEIVPLSTRTIEMGPDGSTAVVQSLVYPDSSTSERCCWTHLMFLDLTTGEALPASGIVRAALSGAMALDAARRTLYAGSAATADLIAVDTTTGEARASSTAAFDDHPSIDDLRFDGAALIDDRLVAIGAGDHLRLYDRSTLALARTIPLGGDVASLGLVADGQGGVVSTGPEGTVRTVVDTGEVLWRRSDDPTHSCGTLHLASPATFACGSYEGVAIMDLATGEPTGVRAPLQLDFLPRFDTIDDETLLLTVDLFPLWMRWRIDGGGAGVDVVAEGRELVDGPGDELPLVVTQPVGGGPMRLWDLERDIGVDEESARIVMLGSGVVARFDEWEALPSYLRFSQLGRARLERLSTGEDVPLRIPGLPASFNVAAGAWERPAFVWWPDGIVAFDPATGEPLGPLMRVPGESIHEMVSISETPDSEHAVVTWTTREMAETAMATETGVFEIATGELVARGLSGLAASRALDDGRIVGIASEHARIYDLDTLASTSALARAIGGGNWLSASSDGRTLLNVGFNNKLTLYDLTAGIPLASPIDSDVPGTRLPGGFLSSDGETLLEGLPDGIRIWDLRPAEQAAHACAVAGRELAPDEWSTYFPGERQVDTCDALTS